MLSRLAFISLIGLCAGNAITGASHAQPSAGNCGILTWSPADQKHIVLPCTASTPAGENATCGITTWSAAEQKHTVTPCTSTTDPARKEGCSVLAWSQAEQRYVMAPCDMPNKSGLSAPIHFGE